MSNKLIMTKILLALMIVTVLAACADDNAATEGASQVREDIIINVTADIVNLDPAQTVSSTDFVMFHQIFSRLVYDSADGFIPGLAESWELAADGLSYTFNIRQDVLFHNGDSLTAHDVVFTLERAMVSPYTAAPLAPISGVTALDDYTVRFDLHHQFAPFLSALQMIWIVGENSLTEAGDAFGRNPIGTGPYRFVSHQPGQSVQLTRFDDYFGTTPQIRDITYMIILNPATVSIAVEAGDIDLAVSAPPGDIARLSGIEGLTTTSFETRHLNFIALNVNAYPLDNPLVRQAIAHAVDRESTIAMVADGFGTPASSFLNRMTFGYSPDIEISSLDQNRARELLAEAGYPDGLEIPIRTIGGGTFDSFAQVLQGSLNQVGITSPIELMDQAAFLNDLFIGQYDIGLVAISLGADGDAWSIVFTSDGGMNFTGYTNPEIDRLFDHGRVITDANERIQTYSEIAQLINDSAAFIPVYFTSTSYVHPSNLRMGWIDANGSYRVSHMRWE